MWYKCNYVLKYFQVFLGRDDVLGNIWCEAQTWQSIKDRTWDHRNIAVGEIARLVVSKRALVNSYLGKQNVANAIPGRSPRKPLTGHQLHLIQGM